MVCSVPDRCLELAHPVPPQQPRRALARVRCRADQAPASPWLPGFRLPSQRPPGRYRAGPGRSTCRPRTIHVPAMPHKLNTSTRTLLTITRTAKMRFTVCMRFVLQPAILRDRQGMSSFIVQPPCKRPGTASRNPAAPGQGPSDQDGPSCRRPQSQPGSGCHSGPV